MQLEPYGKGENARTSKLKEKQIHQIRNSYRSGKTIPEVAAEFGIANNTAYNIIAGKRWCHLGLNDLMRPVTYGKVKCQGCGAEFQRRSSTHRFCKIECRSGN